MSHFIVTCSLGERNYTERFRVADNARIFVETLLGKNNPVWLTPTSISVGNTELTIYCSQLKEILESKGDGAALHHDTKKRMKRFFEGKEEEEIAAPVKPKRKLPEDIDSNGAKLKCKESEPTVEQIKVEPIKDQKPEHRPKGGFKATDIVELMRRNGGVTRDEVLAYTGWKAVSMQQQAASVGVELIIDKSQKPYRYMVK